MSELASESETVELPTVVEPPAPTPRRRSGFWPELSGALAIGLCVLAVAVLGFQVVAWFRATPGPGVLSVIGHLLAAGLAVSAQWFADRRRGWPGALAVLGVLVIAGGALWMFWWA
jgi:hypothetical protein